MKAHLDAAKAILEGIGYPVHIGDVPGSATYPYVLLWSSAGNLDSPAMCGEQSDLNDLMRVTMTATTSHAALFMAPTIRQALIGVRLAVPGRFVQPLRLSGSEPVRVDSQVTLPRTSRHPAFVVDSYRVISEPA